jgi:hypothetical protein
MHHLRGHIAEGTRGHLGSLIAAIMFQQKRPLQDCERLIRAVPVPWDVRILVRRE